MKKQVVIGPWIGEFGWEIMAWQGYGRWLYDKGHQVDVICPVGHSPLYADYARKTFYTVVDFTRAEGPDNPALPHFSRGIVRGKTWIKPFNIGYHYRGFPKEGFERQRFVRYGDLLRKEDLALMHCRWRHMPPNERSATNNWPVADAERTARALVERGYRVVAIGTQKAACCPASAEDYRDCNMYKTIELMNRARFIVGPSSAPSHLAGLCGCPRIVWDNMCAHRWRRWKKDWNPLGEKTILIDTPRNTNPPEGLPSDAELLGAAEEVAYG